MVRQEVQISGWVEQAEEGYVATFVGIKGEKSV